MATNATVKRTGNENAMGTIRRFTKRVQGSGVLRRVRGRRFFERPASAFLRKKQALKSIQARGKYEELAKEGRLPERKRGFRR